MQLTDEQEDSVADAIWDAMGRHEPLKNDSVCSCGVRNNMDGDVLFGHRTCAVSAAVLGAITSF